MAARLDALRFALLVSLTQGRVASDHHSSSKSFSVDNGHATSILPYKLRAGHALFSSRPELLRREINATENIRSSDMANNFTEQSVEGQSVVHSSRRRMDFAITNASSRINIRINMNTSTLTTTTQTSTSATTTTSEDVRLLCAPALGGKRKKDAVIVYLATRIGDVQKLANAILPALKDNFLNRWPYPIVVFVPSVYMKAYDSGSFIHSPTKASAERRLQHLGLRGIYGRLTVAEFNVSFPKAIHWTPGWTSPSGWYTSYLHMNQFFTMTMFSHPALDDYNYYLRMDTDFHVGEVPTDPFCFARKLGKTFLFAEIADSDFTEGMEDWFRDYVTTRKIIPANPKLWNALIAGRKFSYKGYVGLGDLRFFRSEQARAIADAFNRDGRIYTHRWSDQVYYVFLLALLKDASAIGNIPLTGWHEHGRSLLNSTQLNSSYASARQTYEKVMET